MAQHDPEAFTDLFQSEPAQPSPQEVAQWVDVYTRLVGMLEHQLDETKELAGRVPDPVRDYLRVENLKIITEELEIFRGRLSHWRALA